MRLAEETRAEVSAVLKRMVKHYEKDKNPRMRVERQSEEKGGFKVEGRSRWPLQLSYPIGTRLHTGFDVILYSFLLRVGCDIILFHFHFK